jgi:hypothetical protein
MKLTSMAGLDMINKKSALLFFWQPRGAHSPTAELRRDRIFSRVANFLAARLALFLACGLVQQAYSIIRAMKHEKQSAKRSGCEKKLAGKKRGNSENRRPLPQL